jgi:hypothetical protein
MITIAKARHLLRHVDLLAPLVSTIHTTPSVVRTMKSLLFDSFKTAINSLTIQVVGRSRAVEAPWGP